MWIKFPLVSVLILSASILVSILSDEATARRTAKAWPNSIRLQEQDVVPLEEGKPIERELSAGRAHSYSISLASFDYLHLVVDHRGINVFVTLFDPQGKQIVEIDSSTRPRGPAEILLIAEISGRYLLLVRAAEKAAGRYEASVKQRRAATAQDLTNLAGVYLGSGNYVQAEPLLERALTITEKARGEDHPEVASALNALGVLNRLKGDYKRAESLHQRALDIRVKKLKPDDPAIAQSLNNLALIHRLNGDYGQAVSFYLRALSIFEKTLGPENVRMGQYLNNLAAVYQEMGDFGQAETLYQRVLKIFEKAQVTDRPDLAQTLNNLAMLTFLKGDYAGAEPMYRRALEIREKIFGQQHPLVAKTLDTMAVFYDAKGDIGQAIELRNRGLEIRERHLEIILATGSEEQKRAYLAEASLSDETNITISFQVRSAPNNPEAAKMALTTILRRKGRVLDAMSDSLGALRRRLDPRDRELLEQLSTVNSRLATLSLSEQGGAQYQDQIAKLEAEKQRLESAISSRSAEFKSQSQPATIEAVQKLLPADAALVEIAVYQPFDAKAKKRNERFGAARYSAYLLKSEGPPRLVELGDAASIDRNIDSLRKALRNRRRTDVKRLARRVDQQVMRPIRVLLGETRRVLISPDGALNLLPFAALVDEQNRYLVARYSISYLTSGRDLLRLELRQPSTQRSMIVANPAFGEMVGKCASSSRGIVLPSMPQSTIKQGAALPQICFPPLPGTASEARSLKEILPQAVLLTEEQATEAGVKQVSSPNILHIATHGFFLSDAVDGDESGRGLGLPSKNSGTTEYKNPLLRSALALAGANQRKSGEEDGILTALEVSGLNLQGTRRVVLSACDTGVGEVRAGDGVYGLRRALVLAGSESQMMSLWPVSDIGTRDLMIAYYRLLQSGDGRGEALRQVQLRMLKSRDRRHPYYWASFIQSGEWANIEGNR